MKSINQSLLTLPRAVLAQDLRFARYKLNIAKASGSQREIDEAVEHEVLADSNLSYYDEIQSRQFTPANKLH